MKRVLVLTFTVSVLMVAGLLFFRAVFDTTEEEYQARQLIGKPTSEMFEGFGVPGNTFDAADFNEGQRALFDSSKSPGIPFATGNVYIYHLTLTIIIFFEQDTVIKDVFIRKT